MKIKWDKVDDDDNDDDDDDLAEETNYYMRYSEGPDTTGVSDLASWGHEEQGPNRALVSFILQRNLSASIIWTFWAIGWGFM